MKIIKQKKFILFLLLAIYVLSSKGQGCDHNFVAGQLLVMHTCPTGQIDGQAYQQGVANYCIGDNFCVTFIPDPGIEPFISGVNFSFSGSFSGLSFMTPSSYSGSGLVSGGWVTVTGTYWNGFQNCPFSLSVLINVGNPSVTSNSPIYFAIGSGIALNCTPVNAAPPVTYNWLPNSYFVNPSTNQQQNPIVSPPISMVYTVNVIDAYGCTSKTTLEVIAQPYAPLTKTPEGSYYSLANNMMLFKYNGQYANTNLTYKIFDASNNIVASNFGTNVANSLVVNSGDNRYFLDATTFLSGYYTLEVINEKKEKLYLRFKK